MENEVQKKRILSGIQPSGDLTLGSYLGAIKNWAALADEYDCYYMLADMHTITVRQVPAELRRHTLTQVAAYIASGLDPEKNCIYYQSHVSAHAELSWILNCFTDMGELNRMTQFKDKSAKHADNINAGLFTYPVLMAADILLFQSDVVPVGIDQKQHLEITRDIAERFNGIYGDVFTIPEGYFPKVGARVMSLQEPTRKMSKSALTGKTMDEITAEFDGQGYGKFKDAVADSVIAVLEPIQNEYDRISADKAYLQQVMDSGRERASAIAHRTMLKVRKKLGIAPWKL